MFRPDLENPGPDDLAVAAGFMHVLPVGWVEPVDISNAVLFLASDESRFVTGLTMTIDAGSMLKERRRPQLMRVLAADNCNAFDLDDGVAREPTTVCARN